MALTFDGIHKEILEDTTPEIDVEGARNSGKTWVCAAKVWQSCIDHPGIWWLMCRYSGTETDSKLRPEFIKVSRMLGVEPAWNSDESCYEFPAKMGLTSKVFAYGLKTQSKDQRYAKIRGTGVAGVWNDQTEELPEDIALELRALMRQGGYPHQLIFSPNPPSEDSYLADQFPEDVDLPGRKYYCVSLYDNAKNLPDQTIRQLEQAYPPTHAKHKSLILGKRGVNVIGTPVYAHSFLRELHVGVAQYDADAPLLESIEAGKHHPVWLVAQRTYFGGLVLLGGVMGKRLFLHDFLPIVQRYRREWFPSAGDVRLCCDPPPALGAEDMRFTNISTMRDAQLKPTWTLNGNAADVREAVIQSLAGQMKRRYGNQQAFLINGDPSRWLMASSAIIKPSKFFVDGVEGAYVWDENYVSVGNKKVRQPKTDEWVEGAQRCLENISLNFCANKKTDSERDELEARNRERDGGYQPFANSPNAWMGY